MFDIVILPYYKLKSKAATATTPESSPRLREARIDPLPAYPHRITLIKPLADLTVTSLSLGLSVIESNDFSTVHNNSALLSRNTKVFVRPT